VEIVETWWKQEQEHAYLDDDLERVWFQIFQERLDLLPLCNLRLFDRANASSSNSLTHKILVTSSCRQLCAVCW
jgi:hypothetical protein